MIKEKHAGKDTNGIHNEISAIIQKLLEYKCITPTQHKKLLNTLNLIQKKFIRYDNFLNFANSILFVDLTYHL